MGAITTEPDRLRPTEFQGGRRWYRFTIQVPASQAEAVQRIIRGLRPPVRRVRSPRFSGWWREVQPIRLARAFRHHPWLFASYRESSYDRDDRQGYDALLFRNHDRTAFGIREWLGCITLITHDRLRRMAHRIVTDAGYRSQFLSEDPDLPAMWKRH